MKHKILESLTLQKIGAVVATVIALVVFRLMPHAPNWTPILAFAVFIGSSTHINRIQGLIVLAVAMLISDAALGFHSGMWAVYGSLVVIALLSSQTLAGKSFVTRWLAGSIGSSLLFFVVTNFAVWVSDSMYPMTAAGLWQCYVAALPFLSATVGSTLVYFAAFEGLQQLAERLNQNGRERRGHQS